MPPQRAPGKRLVPTSAALLPEEIEEVQAAANTKKVTMSRFMRLHVVAAARRINRRRAAATKSAA